MGCNLNFNISDIYIRLFSAPKINKQIKFVVVVKSVCLYLYYLFNKFHKTNEANQIRQIKMSNIGSFDAY